MERLLDQTKLSVFIYIAEITLVFSKGRRWPRRCSDGITRIIAGEELCLCVGREY